MKKTKILVPALAVLALGMAASVTGTVAWYTAEAQAKVNVTTATGTLGSSASSINAGTYTIDFTITPAAENVELSHVVDASDVTNGLNGVASPTAGKLVYGVISSGTATMREIADISNFATTYTITASWHGSAPSDPADIAFLKGRHFQITLSQTGNVHFLGAGNALTGQSNVDTTTATVNIGNTNTLALTVENSGLQYIHVEPTSLSASETGTNGTIVVAAAENITPSNA